MCKKEFLTLLILVACTMLSSANANKIEEKGVSISAVDMIECIRGHCFIKIELASDKDEEATLTFYIDPSVEIKDFIKLESNNSWSDLTNLSIREKKGDKDKVKGDFVGVKLKKGETQTFRTHVVIPEGFYEYNISYLGKNGFVLLDPNLTFTDYKSYSDHFDTNPINESWFDNRTGDPEGCAVSLGANAVENSVFNYSWWGDNNVGCQDGPQGGGLALMYDFINGTLPSEAAMNYSLNFTVTYYVNTSCQGGGSYVEDSLFGFRNATPGANGNYKPNDDGKVWEVTTPIDSVMSYSSIYGIDLDLGAWTAAVVNESDGSMTVLDLSAMKGSTELYLSFGRRRDSTGCSTGLLSGNLEVDWVAFNITAAETEARITATGIIDGGDGTAMLWASVLDGPVWVNLSLAYPNGTLLFDESNMTCDDCGVSPFWNSSNFSIADVGTWNYNMTSSDEFGLTSSASGSFISTGSNATVVVVTTTTQGGGGPAEIINISTSSTIPRLDRYIFSLRGLANFSARVGINKEVSECVGEGFSCSFEGFDVFVSQEYLVNNTFYEVFEGQVLIVSGDGDAVRLPVTAHVVNLGYYVPVRFGFAGFANEYMFQTGSAGQVVGVRLWWLVMLGILVFWYWVERHKNRVAFFQRAQAYKRSVLRRLG